MQEIITSIISIKQEIAISIIALIISIIALVYTVRTYLLKSGESIRCSYILSSSSIACEDSYVHSIILENLKDRAVVIFKIYFKIGENFFLELENFEDTPLILKPFEAYQKNFEPIIFYSLNTKRIKIDSLLKDAKVKKKLVLSTTNGKYEINTNIKRWDAAHDFFNNYFTAIIGSKRFLYKNRSYGSRTKYLIDIKLEDGTEQVIPIYDIDERIKRFNNFQITKDSLKSKDTLKNFILQQKNKRKMNFTEVEVYEFQKEYEKFYELQDKEVREARYYSKIKYHVIGRIVTIFKNLYGRYENYKLKKLRK